ncbi:yvaG [Symbiodinium pilosum]|uniref:YvaG protein n=1 Tax=Symbiodinium pilosum TaxID=2952 RepID=A0A812YIW7_SYMPI|nr:yvaG [Symbiodinium pilosum]
MGLWAEGDDEKEIRHPAELSEAACLHHVRDRQLCKDVRSLVSGTRMARRAVLWGFRKPWLRHGKGPPWKAALLAPLPLRFLRSRWLEASCLVKLHARDVGGAKLQKAVKSWQMAGRDISARWHGFAIPSSKVLKILKSCSSGGLVELGAGVGYWATLLKRRGVDIAALDIDPPAPRARESSCNVNFGDASSLKKLSHQTLLLCMPPPGEASCADEALASFRGRHVAYVGEWRSGMTATESFHETLLSRYVLEHRVPLPCYPNMRVECFIFRSRGKKEGLAQHAQSELLTCDGCGATASLYFCPATRFWRLCSEACYDALLSEQASLLKMTSCGFGLPVPAWSSWEAYGWLAVEAASSQQWSALKRATPQPEIEGWQKTVGKNDMQNNARICRALVFLAFMLV